MANAERKYLRDLIATVECYITFMDRAMKLPATEKRGKKIAAALNALEMAKDMAKRFGLPKPQRKGGA